MLRGRIIEALMCDFTVDLEEMRRDFGMQDHHLALFRTAQDTFGDLVELTETRFRIIPQGQPLTRRLASFDHFA